LFRTCVPNCGHPWIKRYT